MNQTKCNNRFCSLRADCWTFNRPAISGTKIVTYTPKFTGWKAHGINLLEPIETCEHKLVIKEEID